jgi:ABC-2 type transport system permease protein
MDKPSHALDLSRWRETPRGVGYRRWTIVVAGLREVFRTRFAKALLSVAWTGGLLIAVLGFAFSQSVANGGWLQDLAVRAGPRFEAMFSVVVGLVAMFPDIIVHGVFTAIFWAHSYLGLWLSLIALSTVVPQLITRDRASNALLVYLARPLTSVDYLLGKLGIIVGVIVAVWTGPLLLGWLLSMVFATDRDFIVHSFEPLLRALAFNGLALVVLAAVALGASTLGRRAPTTIALWMLLWIGLGVASSPPRAPLWIKRASPTRDLGEVRQEFFRFDTALANAATKLPLLDQRAVGNVAGAAKRVAATDFNGALGALGVMTLLSSWVFFRKLRPE